MLEFEFNVCQPRFCASWVSKDILLVDRVFLGLSNGQPEPSIVYNFVSTYN
jgi:hypothetical protein